MRNIFYILILLLFIGCAKDQAIVNPYDNVNNVEPGDSTIYFSDSTNFASLYNHVFMPYCANSGCHDGNFEPDFRTIESSYNTLVYHPIIKNDINNTYQYRVHPNSADMSVLYVRLTEEIDPSSEIMPISASYDTTHPWHNDKELHINNIREWINGGALDMFGNSPSQPNKIPEKHGVIAYASGQTSSSIPRLGVRGPIQVPSSLSSIDIWFSILDDSFLASEFASSKVKFSDNLLNFDVQPAYNLEVYSVPLIAPGFYIVQDVEYYLKYTYDISNLSVGDEVFFKVYVDDNFNGVVEIPNNGSSLEVLKYFTFEII